MWHATELRTSRRTRRCARCRQTIGPGEQYLRLSLPPGGELGYLGWVREAEHIACEIDYPTVTGQNLTSVKENR